MKSLAFLWNCVVINISHMLVSRVTVHWKVFYNNNNNYEITFWIDYYGTFNHKNRIHFRNIKLKRAIFVVPKFSAHFSSRQLCFRIHFGLIKRRVIVYKRLMGDGCYPHKVRFIELFMPIFFEDSWIFYFSIYCKMHLKHFKPNFFPTFNLKQTRQNAFGKRWGKLKP